MPLRFTRIEQTSAPLGRAMIHVQGIKRKPHDTAPETDRTPVHGANMGGRIAPRRFIQYQAAFHRAPLSASKARPLISA